MERRGGIEMKCHEWREKGEEGTCQFRATHHAGRWEFCILREGEEEWERQEPISLEHLCLLREVLRRKYQRRRVPFEHLDQIDKLIRSIQ